MGRPKKKDPAIVRVAEAVGITLQTDVMCLEEVAQFPKLAQETPRNQGIVCALACGYSQGFIAKMFGLAQPTVWEIIQRIDPDGMFKLSPNAKKAFVTRLAEARGMEALSSITPEKLEESSAKELSGIAKDMAALSSSLNTSKHKDLTPSRLDSLIDGALEAERVEVSASPCEGGEEK